MATWSVVAILKEPWPVLERFISWHLQAGAERLHLVFDDPEDPSIDRISNNDRIDIHRGTDAFWIACRADRSLHFTHRQNMSMHYLYKRATSDWVVNLDGDELVYCKEGRFADVLAAQPDDVRSLLLGVAEHVWPVASQEGAQALFRLPMWRRLSRRVYGDFARFMEENGGLVGHTIGKSAVRAGLPSKRFHPHWLVARGGGRIVDATVTPIDGVGLLHFYAHGYDDWRRKIAYRAQARARNRRDDILQELSRHIAAGDEQALRAIYRQMHMLDGRQMELLSRRERLLQVDVRYPSLVADLTSAGSGGGAGDAPGDDAVQTVPVTQPC